MARGGGFEGVGGEIFEGGGWEVGGEDCGVCEGEVGGGEPEGVGGVYAGVGGVGDGMEVGEYLR